MNELPLAGSFVCNSFKKAKSRFGGLDSNLLLCSVTFYSNAGQFHVIHPVMNMQCHLRALSNESISWLDNIVRLKMRGKLTVCSWPQVTGPFRLK